MATGVAVSSVGVAIIATDKEGFDRTVRDLKANCDNYVNGIKAKNIKKHSAEEANKWWKDVMGYENPPYKPGTETTIFEVAEDTKFVRVYDGEHSRQGGGWFMKAEDIEGLTPKQIQNKYALEYEPKFVTDVVVKKGTEIRMGIANSLYGQAGCGIQFDSIGQIFEVLNERLL